MNGPMVVAFSEDQSVRLEALSSGCAIGPVVDVEWQVENGDETRTFVDEDHARNWWHENGGTLMAVQTTAWVAAPDWQRRAGVGQ